MPLRNVQDHALRERQKRRVEAPGDDVRLLHQGRVFFHEKRILDELRTHLARCGMEPTHHDAHSLFSLDEDVTRAQEADVVGWSRHLKAATAEKTVPLGRAPGSDSGELQGKHVLAEERDEPADGPAERGVAARPAHRLSKGDFRAHALERLAEQIRGW